VVGRRKPGQSDVAFRLFNHLRNHRQDLWAKQWSQGGIAWVIFAQDYIKALAMVVAITYSQTF